MLSGENHRERVVAAASARSFLLRDVAAIPLGVRPTTGRVLPDALGRRRGWRARHILYGRTGNARRSIPMMQRVAAQLVMSQTDAASE